MTTNRLLAILKAALNRAFHDGKVPSDTAWRKVKPFRAVTAARARYLSVAEAQRLLNAADPEFRPLLRAALETGARYGELTRLQMHDFNGDAGTLAVWKSKSASRVTSYSHRMASPSSARSRPGVAATRSCSRIRTAALGGRRIRIGPCGRHVNALPSSP